MLNLQHKRQILLKIISEN